MDSIRYWSSTDHDVIGCSKTRDSCGDINCLGFQNVTFIVDIPGNRGTSVIWCLKSSTCGCCHRSLRSCSGLSGVLCKCPASCRLPIRQRRVWDSSNSRLACWKWFVTFNSLEDLPPILLVKIMLLNEQC